MPIPNDQFDHVLNEIAAGNDAAAHALRCFAHAARLADNIVDGDSQDGQRDMAEILKIAFVDLAGNPFYRAHAEVLAGPWLNAILGWHIGDEWHGSDNRKTRMFGFVYREAIEQVAHTVAYLVGGYDHAKAAMGYLHRVSHAASPETFEDWEAE